MNIKYGGISSHLMFLDKEDFSGYFKIATNCWFYSQTNLQ